MPAQYHLPDPVFRLTHPPAGLSAIAELLVCYDSAKIIKIGQDVTVLHLEIETVAFLMTTVNIANKSNVTSTKYHCILVAFVRPSVNTWAYSA